jgi:DNA polymerase III alpha subunit (gram-positive type)
MHEIYISTDIEADGLTPGMNSMLSFASAAFLLDGSLHSTFTVNLKPLPGASTEPLTMAWWQKHPAAWEKCQENQQAPAEAMKAYVAWLKSLPGKLVFVGYPASFDFGFIHWYLKQFTGENPFGFNVLDIKTYAMAVLKLPYRESMKANWPKRWLTDHPHTHVALDDALEQGHLFCQMLQENLQD